MDTDNAQLSATEPPRRSRGRPRKTADERDDGTRRQALLHQQLKLLLGIRASFQQQNKAIPGAERIQVQRRAIQRMEMPPNG